MAVRKPAPKTAAAPAPKAEAAPAAAPKAAPAPKAEAAPKAKAAVPDVAEVQSTIRKAATKSLEQGRVAYDKLKEASDEAVHSVEASFAATSKGAAELAAKALEAVKSNANATFDHLKALAGVKNVADAISLHSQFVRSQSEVAVAQAKEFAEIAKKTAAEASAPIQEQLKKPLSKG